MNKLINTSIIINFIKDNNLTRKEFCLKCKICPQTLNRILKNNNDIQILSLLKITKILKIPLHLIFNKDIS